MKRSLLTLSLAASLAMAESFTLGQVSVQSSIDDVNVIEQSVDAQVIAQNNERTVAETLDNISGVSLSNMGARNEATVSIRGFSASRVGVFIDGVPVYVPYDGNFDYARFLTNDIAQIDISKGYSSIAYGANTMGGVINIISKKPTKELEGNLRAELILDSDAHMSRHLESINVGSRLGGFYTQLSGTYSKRDHFRLSDAYEPVAGSEQPEGDRVRSYARDQKVSLKAGYIAQDTSEIALSYANQKGRKQQPLSVDADLNSVRYWDWPYWNKETLSLSGVKNFGTSYMKALAYYDVSENSLYSYGDNTYTFFAPQGFSFKSRYDDYSYGARLEYGVETGANFLKVAANYKKDVHRGYDIEKFVSGETLAERFEGHTISLGAEDNYALNQEIELLAGLSYDRLEADEVFYPDGYQGLDVISAFNPQAALIYVVNPNAKVRVSASQKTYLPSMKDRYSGGLGTKVANPDLDKELANHYELSYAHETQDFHANVSLYFTKVKDAIQGVATDETYVKSGKTYYKEQNQNVGTFEHKGAELDLSYSVDATKIGGNYAYIDVKNTKDSSVKRTGVPKHQLFAFAQQELLNGFSVYANMKLRSGVYEQISDRSYLEMASFTTFDAKVMYAAVENLTFEAGVKNLTDKMIQYNVGFPEAGREYFATMNYKF
jgi:iron complex outermembrane receptor protein